MPTYRHTGVTVQTVDLSEVVSAKEAHNELVRKRLRKFRWMRFIGLLNKNHYMKFKQKELTSGSFRYRKTRDVFDHLTDNGRRVRIEPVGDLVNVDILKFSIADYPYKKGISFEIEYSKEEEIEKLIKILELRNRPIKKIRDLMVELDLVYKFRKRIV